ncbi:hypothetical protein A3E89_02690 [Candidatus Campbellbacteria bacterium RIFCSPHIGHO2_12_FULL_35_10]|uniref:Peptidase M50 domain-containing protein n=1 Tax=Candidatus Campbellbacteria bacterium RIFCSPHIGHO2_12_FULL_35_10 TaxID=1797578 RepID=A0A1F5EME5_9BACT|nr:MAG: hypothetical protein A3E89_02690 [Candidatus Campbellbacteria bacterium RIFCSPHIGHO2_12_FULL_35_10]
MELDFIFSIIILIMSVVIHEVSHGYMAYAFGDPTAKIAKRLTLNPFSHLDLVGSIIVPMIMFISNTGFIFGWAKPVPYNPYNLRNARWGEPLVALAGPLSNFMVAIVFGLLIRLGLLGGTLMYAGSMIVLVNLVLGIFNLIPIPPLDGSKVLFGFFPYQLVKIRNFLEANLFWILLIFVFFLWKFVTPLVAIAFSLLTGLSL